MNRRVKKNNEKSFRKCEYKAKDFFFSLTTKTTQLKAICTK